MNAQPIPKYYASLSLEEATLHPNLKQQNWLLTYVDVFILIIMLVITLMALSEFKSEIKKQETRKEVRKQSQKTVIPITLQQPEKVLTKKQEPSITTIEKPIKTEKSIVENKDITKQHSQTAQTEKQPEKVPPAPKDVIQQPQPDNNDTLQKKFKDTLSELGLIDSVQMKVTLGYAQLEIQDKILFKSSDATLMDSGKELLKMLNILLKQSTGLIYIEGHTDNRPIKTAKFPSNWELGAARATSVLHYLASQKLDATRLRAVTFGSTKPLADNSTKEGREKNRRVSLAIKISDEID